MILILTVLFAPKVMLKLDTLTIRSMLVQAVPCEHTTEIFVALLFPVEFIVISVERVWLC